MPAITEAKKHTDGDICRTPGSPAYVAARECLAEHGLRECFDIMGITEGMNTFQRKELAWAFGLLDAESMTEVIEASLRTAYDNAMPIIFDWEHRKSSCSVKTTVVGGKMFLTVGTPMLVDGRLLPGSMPAAFVGAGVKWGAQV